MLKFYIEKDAEGDTRPAFKEIVKFDDFEDFLQWANYHRTYIRKVETLDQNSTYSFMDVEGNVVADDYEGAN
jgi:hypothetical protein